jgi:hypothetical protein
MIYAPVYVVISRGGHCYGVFWSEEIAAKIANHYSAFISKQEILEHSPLPSN